MKSHNYLCQTIAALAALSIFILPAQPCDGANQTRAAILQVQTKTVLAYIEYTDTSREYPNTLAAIDSVSTNYTVDELTDYTQLDSMLPGHDVLLIPEQEKASSSLLETIGAAWATTLQSFLDRGGVVIQCDYSPIGGYGLLTSAGLMTITSTGGCTSATVTVVAPDDPVAQGVSSTYTAESGSRYYTTTEETVVVERTGYGPVVINKEAGLGNVVLIGHDYYNSNPDQNRIVGNAVFNLPLIPDDLQVTPFEDFISSGNEGGPFDPNCKTYTLTNTGPNSLDWAASATQPWLDVEPNSGTLGPSDSNMVEVSLNAYANTLPEGYYSDMVTFTNTTSGAIRTRNVVLEVLPMGMIFYDNFPSTTLNPSKWTSTISVPTIDDLGIGEPSPAYSLRLNGDPDGGDAVESQILDLSIYNPVQLKYWYEQTGGGESPDAPGEDLIIEYWDGSTWVELERQLGTDPDMTSYIQSIIDLPTAALHAGFRVRFRSVGTAGPYDDWFVDDVELTGELMDDLKVTPAEGLASSGYEGGPFIPSSKSYTLTNVGHNSLDWTAESSLSWVDVEPNGGTLLPAESNVVEVSLNAYANTLPPGDYNDITTFTNTTSGYVQTRDVTLEVLAIPGEIEVTDTIPPPNDLNLPFGDVIAGLSRTEHITITNTDHDYSLIVMDISFGGGYFEDFNDGLAQDWQCRVPSYWSVVSGEYRAYSTVSLNMESVYTGQVWENCSAQAVMRRTGDTGSAARLVLRATDDFSREDYIGSAYMIAISGNGNYHVGKLVDGSFYWLQEWTSSPYLNAGEASNVVMVNIEGPVIEVYFNGNLAWSGSDSSIPEAGRVGLMGYNSSSGTTHYFDNVFVAEPETISQTISNEQQWYNDHPYENSNPDVAPEGWEPPEYPSGDEVPPQILPVRAVALQSGNFLLENVPSLPVTIPPSGSITFDVNFVPSEITDYHATLVIVSNDEDEPELEVQLSGTGIPEYLEITPEEEFEFSGHPGGPFVPSNTSYLLTNTGSIDIDWIAEPNVPWLDVSPSNGTLQPGKSATVTVWPNVQAEDMNEGYHCGDLVVTDITTTVKLKRRVCLNVYTEPKIWASPYSFDVTICQGDTQTQKLTIGNGGGGDLNFSLSSREIPGYLPAAKTAVAEIEISEDQMVLEYEFNEPIIYEGDDYDLLVMEGLEQYQRVGAPIIPVRPVKVMVPLGKEVLTTRTIPLEIYDLPGSYWLPPAQKPYPLSYQGTAEPTKPDPAIYNQATPWPGIDHEEVAVQSKRGYQLFVVNLFPLQYVPTTGKVSYTSKLRLEVDLVDAPTSAVLRPSDAVEAELSATVDNPAVLEAYPESNTSSLETLEQPTALPPGGPYQYVIITNETLEAAPGPWNFQALRDAKIAHGMTATIVTTNWIYANYDGTRPDGGSDNQTRIRNFLIDAYQNWGTEYVLLGGANAVVPARLFWVDSHAGDVDYMPVDMYYGCVEPQECTFDYDADGRYGEPTDGVGGSDVDLLAEIYVGRAPVEDTAELENSIKKTLTYGLTQNEYLSHIAMLGEWLGFGGVSEYAKDSKEQIRLGGVYDGYFTYGFENHTQSSFIDFITEGCLPEEPTCCWPLYDKDTTWSKSDLICLMNGGVHVFNHLGHADETHCMKLYTSELASLTNTDYFFAYSQGCYPGAFDVSNCFAEVITSMEYGAFAVVMNARYGYGRGNSTDGPSHRFDRQFWDAVLCEGMLEIGQANQDSKEDNLWDINGECIRWCYYELNLFGDPAQRFRFTKSCDWMDFVPEAGTIAPGEAIDVNVVFNADEMAPGTNRGEIAILSDDPYTPELTIPVTMTVEPIDYFTELFEPGDPFDPNDPNRNDMAYRTLTFRPNSSCSYYGLCINEAVDFPVDPNGGTIVSLKDDDYIPVNLQGAYINFFGTDYDTFYIGSNGYISFISGDIRYLESLPDHLDLPRISALFDDLNPSAGGLISWKQLDDRVVVTFENVPEYSLSNSNSFQIEIRFNGKVRITLLDIAAQDGLVGLSEGYGLPSWFTQSDLSEYSLCNFVGDINGDLNTDLIDFAILASYWRAPYQTTTIETVSDQFNSISYSGNDGTQNWSNDWQEIGESDGPSAGDVQVVNSVESCALRVGRFAKGKGLFREANLIGATFAALTFNWQRGGPYHGNDTMVDISSDGGTTWFTLLTIPDGRDRNLHSESFNISAYIAPNTQIRFIANDRGGGYIYFDNVQIEYDITQVNELWCDECDFNHDFRIDFHDLLVLAEHWLE